MAQDGTRKILRVGIIQSGRIVEERLVRKREDVTIGQASKNTFILPIPQLPKSFTLFEAKGDAYHLVFEEGMEGRVSIGDQVVDLKGLAKSGNVKRRGGRYVVPLDNKSRGKVVIGEFTLLFQFVDAPPVLPKPQLPAAARGGLAQRIDWTFVNILLLSMLLQGGFGVGLDIWWRQSGRYLQEQYTGRQTRSYEILKAEVQREEEEEPELEEEPEAEAEAEEEAPEPEPAPAPEPEPEPKPEPDKEAKADEPAEEEGEGGEEAERETTLTKEQVQEKVRDETFLHVLGSEEDGDAGLGPSTLKQGLADAKLDDAFRNLDGGVATAEPGKQATFKGKPKAVKKGKEYKGISDKEAGGERIATKTVKSKKKEAGAGKEVKVRVKVRGGTMGAMTGTGRVDKKAIARVFSRRKRAIQYCYEKALKVNENVKGKVTIKFTIGPAGRITNVSIVTNSTGDASIGQCIMNKVKTWRFPPPEGGSVTATFPFVLSKG
ncbi:MAG: TonB family protein [Myxococcota bacterium]